MATGGEMPTWLYLLTICLILGAVLIVFGMKYFSAAVQARARIASDAAYRALAEQAVNAQTENQAALAAMRGELSRIAASLASVEKVLQQIE
jgi:uncharacterized membrane protein